MISDESGASLHLVSPIAGREVDRLHRRLIAALRDAGLQMHVTEQQERHRLTGQRIGRFACTLSTAIPHCEVVTSSGEVVML